MSRFSSSDDVLTIKMPLLCTRCCSCSLLTHHQPIEGQWSTNKKFSPTFSTALQVKSYISLQFFSWVSLLEKIWKWISKKNAWNHKWYKLSKKSEERHENLSQTTTHFQAKSSVLNITLIFHDVSVQIK